MRERVAVELPEGIATDTALSRLVRAAINFTADDGEITQLVQVSLALQNAVAFDQERQRQLARVEAGLAELAQAEAESFERDYIDGYFADDITGGEG